jgi:hypothetical protein
MGREARRTVERVLGRGPGAPRGDDHEKRQSGSARDGFFDGMVACLVSLVLNVWITTVIRNRAMGWEGSFLVKIYWYTLLLRHAIAIFLNAYAGDMRFADAFWGD